MDISEDSSELFDVFHTLKKDDRISETKDLLVEPKIAVSPESKNFQFILEPQSDFLLLSETRFEIALKITKPNGTDIAPYSAATGGYLGATFDNLTAALCIKNIIVRANDQVIADSADQYGVNSYVIALTSYDKQSLETKFENTGFYLERQPSNRSLAVNDGMKKRELKTQGSNWYKLSSGIFLPIFMINKCLVPMVRLVVEVTLVSAEYLIKSATTESFAYQIKNPHLIFRKISTSHNFQLDFERKLLSSPAIYNIENFGCKTFICDTGRVNFVINDMFMSTFPPNKVIVFCNSQTNSVGSFTSSPLSFGRNHISRARLFVNDRPCPSVEFDLTSEGVKRAFSAFHGSVWGPSCSPIDIDLFQSEHFFLCFDMLQLAGVPRSKTLAHCRLDIEFSQATTENLKFYVFYLSDEQILVNHQRIFQKNF